jgi:hypothetical protein
MTSPPELVSAVEAVGGSGTAVALIGDGGTAVAVDAEETATGDETMAVGDSATCVGAQPAASNTTAVRINPKRIH